MQKNFFDYAENKDSKSSEAPKLGENLYQKTLFVFSFFHVFIAYLPELD